MHGSFGAMHERIQRYLRDRVAAEREAVPAGAFTLYIHPTEDHPFLNYAIPNEGAEPDDGSALAAAAGQRLHGPARRHRAPDDPHRPRPRVGR